MQPGGLWQRLCRCLPKEAATGFLQMYTHFLPRTSLRGHSGAPLKFSSLDRGEAEPGKGQYAAGWTNQAWFTVTVPKVCKSMDMSARMWYFIAKRFFSLPGSL